MLPASAGVPWSAVPDLTLITFPPSLDSELARFLLHHYRVPHREVRHTILISSFFTLWYGKTAVFPLLIGPGIRHTLPREIIDHFDPLAPPELRLLDPARSAEIEAAWKAYNQEMAYDTAVFAYYHLLRNRDIMVHPLTGGAPSWEVSLVSFAYPLFAGFLRPALRLTEDRASESLTRIRAAMDRAAASLSDGRPFLTGQFALRIYRDFR